MAKGELRMHNHKLEQIANDLTSFYLVFHKKVVCTQSPHPGKHTPPLYYSVLGILNSNGALPMSEIGKKLLVSKPHMTCIIDKLILEGLVKRLPDQEDRRIIKIEITSKGRKFLLKGRQLVKDKLKEQFLSLDGNDIDDLYDSLEKIKKIFLKLNKGGQT